MLSGRRGCWPSLRVLARSIRAQHLRQASWISAGSGRSRARRARGRDRRRWRRRKDHVPWLVEGADGAWMFAWVAAGASGEAMLGLIWTGMVGRELVQFAAVEPVGARIADVRDAVAGGSSPARARSASCHRLVGLGPGLEDRVVRGSGLTLRLLEKAVISVHVSARWRSTRRHSAASVRRLARGVPAHPIGRTETIARIAYASSLFARAGRSVTAVDSRSSRNARGPTARRQGLSCVARLGTDRHAACPFGARHENACDSVFRHRSRGCFGLS